MQTDKVRYLGNYFGFTGKSYDGWVIDKDGLSYPMLACMCHGNVPKIIVEDFYSNREVRVYKDFAPTIRSERLGLKVVENN